MNGGVGLRGLVAYFCADFPVFLVAITFLHSCNSGYNSQAVWCYRILRYLMPRWANLPLSHVLRGAGKIPISIVMRGGVSRLSPLIIPHVVRNNSVVNANCKNILIVPSQLMCYQNIYSIIYPCTPIQALSVNQSLISCFSAY